MEVVVGLYSIVAIFVLVFSSILYAAEKTSDSFYTNNAVIKWTARATLLCWAWPLMLVWYMWGDAFGRTKDS